jgi:hypothetical protein
MAPGSTVVVRGEQGQQLQTLIVQNDGTVSLNGLLPGNYKLEGESSDGVRIERAIRVLGNIALNDRSETLAFTGSSVLGVVPAALMLIALGSAVLALRRKHGDLSRQ